jgi:hypothetical protein
LQALPCTSMEVCVKPIHSGEHMHTRTQSYALAIASFAVHIHGALPQAYTFGGTHAHTHTIIHISNCKLCRAHPWRSASSLYIRWNTYTHTKLYALAIASFAVHIHGGLPQAYTFGGTHAHTHTHTYTHKYTHMHTESNTHEHLHWFLSFTITGVCFGLHTPCWALSIQKRTTEGAYKGE